MMRHLLLLGPLLFACSHSPSDPAYQSAYLPSLFEYQRGHFDKALAEFPEREEGGFITSLEKAWIGLGAGGADERVTVGFGKNLEKLQSLDVSDELVSAFYKEQIDTYYPAEHEAVILHLTNAMLFLKKNAQTPAKIELRRAARYLQTGYGQNRRVGDSPSLRLWLAALWYAVGDYEAAHVDLRVAMDLAPEAKWIRGLIVPKGHPVTLDVVFAGAGPTLSWQPLQGESENPIANLSFVPSVEDVDLQLKTEAGADTLKQHLNTRDWYLRHQRKNQTLAYAVRGGAYAGKAAAVGTAAVLNTAAAVTLGLLVGTGGVGAGVLAALAIGGEGGASIGFAIGFTGVKAAMNVMDSAQKQSQEWLENGLGELESYRYVRYLPDVIYIEQGGVDLENVRKLQTLLRYQEDKRIVTFRYYAARQDAGVKVVLERRHFYDQGLIWTYRSEEAHGERDPEGEHEGRGINCSDNGYGADGRLPRPEELTTALDNLQKMRGLYPKAMVDDLQGRNAFWVKGPTIWTKDGARAEKATLICVVQGNPPHPMEQQH